MFPFHILEGNTNIDIFLFIELNRVRGKTTKLLNNLGENLLLINYNIFIYYVTYFVPVLRIRIRRIRKVLDLPDPSIFKQQ